MGRDPRSSDLILPTLAACGAVWIISWRLRWIRANDPGDRVFGRFAFTIGASCAVLLAAYLASLMISIRAAGRPGGDRSAPGCLSFVAILVGLMLAVLAVGLAFRVGFLIHVISVLTIVPLVFVGLNNLLEWWRK